MEYTVKLQRDSLESAWGFRLQGGVDLKSSLTVQRVFSGSPAEGELQRGDIIVAIDNRDATSLTHSAAEQSIKSAGGELALRIKRTGPNHSLPHTALENRQDKQNMYNHNNTAQGYGSSYYGGAPQGSKLAPQDQAMLNLVSHSLSSRPMYHPNMMQAPYQQPMGYYNEPNNQQHYGWVPAQAPSTHGDRKFYQPSNFNRPTPGPLAYKPSKNPYSNTASAAHLQYNSPLGLYSAKNAQNALSTAVPGDSAAGKTIKLSSYQGGETKGDIVDSPTLRYVLREDQVKAKTGHNPDMKFYKEIHEYGPGMVPLKAYKEEVDDVPSSDF